MPNLTSCSFTTWLALAHRYSLHSKRQGYPMTFEDRALAARRAAACFIECAGIARHAGKETLAWEYEAAARDYIGQSTYWLNRRNTPVYQETLRRRRSRRVKVRFAH